MRKTLAELEALPELKKFPGYCMCCGKPTPSVSCDVIVYRLDGKNLTFDEARQHPDCEELTVAEICIDCNDTLYS